MAERFWQRGRQEKGTGRVSARETASEASAPIEENAAPRTAVAEEVVYQIRFGDWLVQRGLVDQEQVTEALAEQKRSGGRLGEILSRLNILSEAQVGAALAEYLSVGQWTFVGVTSVDTDVAQSLPERIARRYRLVALQKNGEAVRVAMVDPLDVVARDTVAQIMGCRIEIAIGSERDVGDAIEAVYQGSEAQEQRIRDLVDVVVSTADPDQEPVQATEGEHETADISGDLGANRAPVIRFVDLMLNQAVKSKASDIHVEPQEKAMLIRMRVDGMLREMIAPPRKMQAAVIARIKILSGMDIAERRLPQDGRLKIKAPRRDIDVRVSVLPTIYGEKVVMRILDREAVSHDLETLGFEPRMLEEFKSAISKPHGILIVTGPTGSGKSTTLYSALNYLRDPCKNITTVEDPVEYRLEGINQIQTRPEIGLTFASCLRSILRQDPDILLIGEIRDRETMEIAMQASLTGHLVLTTLHTNDAPSTLSRLAYMGLERYLVASTLNLVTAQRLLRRVCSYCATPIELPESSIRMLSLTPEILKKASFVQGKGCDGCNGTGYSGRLPIFESLPMDQAIRERITRGDSDVEIRVAARSMGYGGLVDSAIERLCNGMTTMEEVLRVAFVENSGGSAQASERNRDEQTSQETACVSTA